MSILQQLMLVKFQKSQSVSPTILRRQRLCQRIDEQIQLLLDPAYSPTVLRKKQLENGNTVQVETRKKIHQWWRKIDDSTIQLQIKYGSHGIELAKGKDGI